MNKIVLLLFLCIGCNEQFEMDIGRNSAANLSHPECEATQEDPNYPECVTNNIVFNTHSDCGGPAYYTSTSTITYGQKNNPVDCTINYDFQDSYSGLVETDSSTCSKVNGSYVCDYNLSLTEAPDYAMFSGTLTVSCPNSMTSTYTISASAASAFAWQAPACAPGGGGGGPVM
jgi:hypothetical protein